MEGAVPPGGRANFANVGPDRPPATGSSGPRSGDGGESIQGDTGRLSRDEPRSARVRVHQSDRAVQGWLGQRTVAKQHKQQRVCVSEYRKSAQGPGCGGQAERRGAAHAWPETERRVVRRAKVRQVAPVAAHVALRLRSRDRGAVLQENHRRHTDREDHLRHVQDRLNQRSDSFEFRDARYRTLIYLYVHRLGRNS